MHEDARLRLNCGDKGARQGFSLNPYLFHIFIDDVMDYIN
jgi:hypothetical protein